MNSASSMETQRSQVNTWRPFCYSREHRLTVLIALREDLLPTSYMHGACESPNRNSACSRPKTLLILTEILPCGRFILLSIRKMLLSPTKERMRFLTPTGAFDGGITKRERHQSKKVQIRAANLPESQTLCMPSSSCGERESKSSIRGNSRHVKWFTLF